MVGHIDDNAVFLGAIKLAGDGAKPKAFLTPGVEKSSIPSFRIMPVDLERNLQPNLKNNNIFFLCLIGTPNNKQDITNLHGINSACCYYCIAIRGYDYNIGCSMVL